ncbi:MAG: hypothetical protein ABSE69_09185 [Roseiarcus sp.]
MSDKQQSPEEKRAAEIEDAIRKADANDDGVGSKDGTQLDKTLAALDSISRKLDAAHKRMDQFEQGGDNGQDEPGTSPLNRRKDARRRDADEDERDKDNDMNDQPDDDEIDEGIDPETGGPTGRAKRLAADSFGRAALTRRQDYMLGCQARADAVASRFGNQAPRPMDGEKPRAYRCRLLKPYKHNSKEWAQTPDEILAALPKAVFDVAEAKIYSDSVAASATPDVSPGILMERRRTDPSGHNVTEFFGNGTTFIRELSRPGRLVVPGSIAASAFRRDRD